MKRALFFSSLLAALAWSCAASAANDKPALTLADLRKQVSVSSPQIAPDGSHVLLLVSRRDFVKDVVHTNLVLVDVRSHAGRDLVRDAHLSGVAWSPDGRFVAYVAETGAGDEKADQLFVLPMDGGEPLQLTHEKKGVEELAWRPDSRALAYVAGGEASNAKAIARHDDAFDVTEEAWTAQAAPVADVLYEIDAGGGTARRIAHWSWNVAGGFTYAADGRSLFVTRTKPNAHPNRYLATEVVRVVVRDGAVTPLDAIGSAQNSPLRSEDGRAIAYAFANPRGTMQSEIALADADGTHARFLTRRLDRNADLLAFDPAGGVVVAANDATYRRLYRVGADGSVGTYPLGALAAVSEASIAKDGTLAFTGSTLGHPGELYVLLPHATAPVRLTDYNAWIDSFALGVARTVTWRTADGLTADGVLISPPHGRGAAPLVLVIHGGPTSASNLAFSGFPQVLAAHGWAVFEPNYRGSDNLGLVFARTTVPHIASVPGSDIELGLARVLSMHVADPSRVAVSGWSEGGLMTSWLIGHDTRWKAAVSGAAVNDWTLYSAMTDAKDFTPQFVGPSPWTDPSLMSTFDAESPLTYASSVKTPTLILSDAGDYRVPTPLAYEFYHDVRATGTPVQFVVYPVNGHFPSDPVRSEDVNRRWEAWLVKYL